MTKALDDTFNLPSLDEDENNLEKEIEKYSAIIAEKGLSLEYEDDGTVDIEKELSVVYEKAIDSHEKILDFAWNVEHKNAPGAMSAAAKMLDIAMKASTNKAIHKLNSLKLKIDRLKINNSSDENEEDNAINVGEAYAIDKDELLSKLMTEIHKK